MWLKRTVLYNVHAHFLKTIPSCSKGVSSYVSATLILLLGILNFTIDHSTRFGLQSTPGFRG